MKTGRLAILALVLFMFGCQNEDTDFITPKGLVKSNYITAFRFLKGVNPGLPLDMEASITEHKITLQVPPQLAFTNLVASFTSLENSKVYIGNTEQSSGKTVNNFAAPLVYKVIAPDGSLNYYNVELNMAFPELDQALSEVMQQYKIPGVSVAIVKNEKLVFAKGYGYANKETNLPVGTESLFRVASISKPITVVAILKLVQDGKISLTDKVFGPAGILKNDYGKVPAGSNIENITVQNLLDHKSGWTNQPNDPMMVNLNYNHQQIITDVVQNRPLTYAPGSTFYYSNFGYCVLGRIIQKVSGKSYEDYVQSDLLLPSGIIDMRLANNLPQQSAINEVTYYQENDNPYAYHIARMDAHGGWLATATDLMRLMVRIDRNNKKTNLVSDELLNHTYMGYNNWYHTGSLPGTSAILTRLDNEYSFAVLANTRNNQHPHEITEAFNKVLKDQILTKTNWSETDLFTRSISENQ